MKKKLMILAAGSVAALGVFAGTAAADNSPYGGAANMVNPHALPGMGNAMGTNNANGDNGMWCAVFVTSGALAPGSCNGTTPLP